jgi:uncharacterized protein YbjT (DUF2867 family)
VNGIVEVAGPEQFRVDQLVRRVLTALGDPREVITDPNARYFGARLDERTLMPGNSATIGRIRVEDWFGTSANAKPKAAQPVLDASASTQSSVAPRA